MKMPWIIICMLISSIVYGQQAVTVKELESREWKNLSPGIDYISIQDQKDAALSFSSVAIKLKGISGTELGTVDISADSSLASIDSVILSILNSKLVNSREGYLRINLWEMLRPLLLSGMIFLKGDYDPSHSFRHDSIALKNIPGIDSAIFISKEKAKQRYLGAGNDDWSHVLDQNPLPASIEITLAQKDWNEELLETLKKLILAKVPLASEVSLPTHLYFKNMARYYFEYRRK